MPEGCPLNELDLTLLVDREGVLWEPKIPPECFKCILSVPEENRNTESYHVVDEDTGEPYPDYQDRFSAWGIKVIDASKRVATIELGIDLCGDYDGPLESESIFGFSCRKLQ